MKKITLLTFTIISIIFTSCSNDLLEDSTTTPEVASNREKGMLFFADDFALEEATDNPTKELSCYNMLDFKIKQLPL